MPTEAARTALLDAELPLDAATDEPASRRRPSAPVTGGTPTIVVLALVTAALRVIGIGTAGQITVDEIFYTGLGHSVGLGNVPPLIAPGQGPGGVGGTPFTLHPPGYFVLASIWDRVAGRPEDLVDQIVRARGLNVVLATITAVLIYRIGCRVAGRRVAIVGALLFALDPFILRQNNLAFLETATVMWFLVGVLLLLRCAHGDSRRPTLEVVAAGLSMGLAVATKDMAAIPALGTLAVLFALGWCLPRRQTALAFVCGVVPYATFAVLCVAQGYGDELIGTKTIGLRRALGLTVTTGFSSPDSPSLVGRLVGDASLFVFSYSLVAVGAACGAWLLLRSTRPDHRLVGVAATASGALLGYSLVFGTIEEQFLYFLVVPGILALMATAPLVLVWGPPSVRIGAAVVVVVVLVWNLGAWARVRAGSTNGLRELTEFLRTEVPESETVAYTNGVLQFTLQAEGYAVVPLGSPPAMKAAGVRFIVALPQEVADNYSWVEPDSLDRYEQRSDRVFVGSTESPIVVLEARSSTPW